MRWLWLIPLAALGGAIVLVALYWIETGPTIIITLDDGHGIEPGAELRCRGITAGTVENARFTEDLQRVRLTVRLRPDAANLARAGSRFWVVRPRLGPRGVEGMSTLVRPKHLAALPGAPDAERQRRFVALDRPPVLEQTDPEGLEITLIADRRSGLRPGAPVLYRQTPVGRILSATLSPDASAVHLRAYIEPAYTNLIRADSRCWNVSGWEAGLGFRGVSLSVESLETLLLGGIAFATPDQPGDRVHTGHRFRLYPEPEDEWLAWRPALPVGAEPLPPDAPRPRLLRATLHHSSGFFRRQATRTGWLLPVPAGFLAPAELLNDEDPEAALETLGRRIPLASAELTPLGPLVLLRHDLGDAAPAPFPLDRVRRPSSPEPCIVLTGSGEPHLALSPGRLTPIAEGFRIAPGLSIDRALRGAAVVAREDGALIGVLSFEDDEPRVTMLPSDQALRRETSEDSAAAADE